MPETTETNDEIQVRYPVRDLLDQIKIAQAEGFARLEKSMESKADKSDVARMESRLDGYGVTLEKMSGRVDKIEDWQQRADIQTAIHTQNTARSWTRREKIFAAVGSLAMIAATVVGPILAIHGA